MAEQKTLTAPMSMELVANGNGAEQHQLNGSQNGELEGNESEQLEALSPEQALEYLLKLGRPQGYVTYDDVLRVMPHAENNMDQLEDTFAALFEQGIEIGQAGNKSERGTATVV